MLGGVLESSFKLYAGRPSTWCASDKGLTSNRVNRWLGVCEGGYIVGVCGEGRKAE